MTGVKEGEFTLKEKIEIPSGLINAIIAGYQIALNRTLGSGAAAMTQLLIKDIGDFLEELLEEIGFEVHEIKDLKEDIPKSLKMLGISDKVEVEVPSDGAESGDKYVIKIYDSIFKPVAVMLAKKGISFTLSPESFITAAIVRKAVRKVRPNAQVRVKVHPQKSPDEPLVIEVIVR
jgi:phosphoenolpyruvate synthase/pyruvate phosphate dikinase